MWFERIFAGTVIALGLAAGVSSLQPDVALAVPAPAALALTSTPLPLDRDNPALDRIGVLRFMGAVQVRASNPLFGGISALRAGAHVGTGERLLGVSDTGNWFPFTTVERGGRLVGVTDAMLIPVMQPDGRPAPTKAAADSESLDWNSATGDATIVYEQDHRLAHFKGIDASRPASLAAVPIATERLTVMTSWPLNSGGEAMALLPGGARIVIAETARRPDRSRTALVTIGGVTTEIGVEGIEDFSPTDAVAFDDHRILVLHRQFSLSGQGAALTMIDLAPVLHGSPPKTMLRSMLLARWSPPVLLDNMEGLALVRRDGRCFVYMVSDDNLSSLQRTLLMKFELPCGVG
jgi:hypothetical protein